MNTYFSWDYVRRRYPEEANLLYNIEDLLCRVKTCKEDPIKSIQIIKEQINIYQQKEGDKL